MRQYMRLSSWARYKSTSEKLTTLMTTGLSTILILHAGAIGDVVLGTVVPSSIKLVEHKVRVIYWTHESLFDLLRFCPTIDELVPWQKRNSVLKQLGIIRGINPDLIIDLTASLRSRILCLLSRRRTVTYRKQSASERPIMHAAPNFLSTIRPVIGSAAKFFPTLIVSSAISDRVMQEQLIPDGAVGLVPGVGKLRSHRAWPADHWARLARQLTEDGKKVVLIGGPDDFDAARAVSSDAPNLLNLCGKLSLAETAAALSRCSVVVSGDTGPAHIAVAVGTPVIGILGPTYPERSGPYGYLDASFDAGHQCRCHALKSCAVTNQTGPGKCMSTIAVDDVFDRIRTLNSLGCTPLA